MKKKKPLMVFDFDGTITKRDTLIEFIRYAKGTAALFMGLLAVLPFIVLMKLHLYDNGKAKQRLFALFFRGMDINDFNDLCDDFGNDYRDLIRFGAKNTYFMAMANGIPVAVVSASVDNWVIPFFYDSNDDYLSGDAHPIEVVGTKVEVVDGRLTGRFLTPNCYGAEKVRRLKAAYPGLETNRDDYFVAAFGDSRGDKEMLEFADEKHYREF